MYSSAFLLLAALAVGTSGLCPGKCPGFLEATPPSSTDIVPSAAEYGVLLEKLDIDAVLNDIVKLLTNSQSCWPADSFRRSIIGQSYGGLFVRLAWHCAGSFRKTDGVGGCGGGRIRFDPEANWPDNVNLDKARSLLWPIKKKYGDALSWGDLFILAGSGAIMHMGGPVGRVCVGRVDDANGKASLPLGPSSVAPPCPVPGNCQAPLGSALIGLIYVNPEGFMGSPHDLPATAQNIRDVFSRMGMDDEETVALVGGGHAFGKSHGACKLGAGPPPNEQPFNPWPGNCASGRGRDTFSSGIDGQWTSDPLKWDNEYFQLLKRYGPTYMLEKGPGGAYQWYTPARPDLMMQTTDLSFLHDEKYKEIVYDFAEDITKLDAAFSRAWQRLTKNGDARNWSEQTRCFSPKTGPGGQFTSPLLTKALKNLYATDAEDSEEED